MGYRILRLIIQAASHVLRSNAKSMNKLSQRSEKHLSTCHKDLRLVVRDSLEIIDFSVLEGHRGARDQNEYFQKGLSKVRWPDSLHNEYPSEAIHLAPYPVLWPRGVKDPTEKMKRYARFYYLAGIVITVGHRLGIQVKFGGDWNRNHRFDDQTFDDLMHYELVKKPS